MEGIVLGGGCFWCVEGALKGLRGVSEVIPGYSGGHVDNPTYEQVCGKRTGHAEVVRVTFDPEIIGRTTLLEVFFTCHDPTRKESSAASDVYKRQIENLSEYFPSPIVTEVSPLSNFFVAEDYHHDYFANNPGNPYCRVVVAPKIAKTRAKHASLYE